MSAEPVDWAGFTEEFHGRETDRVDQAVADYGLIKNACGSDDRADRFADKTTWEKAFEYPEGAMLLGYSLFLWAMQQWEYTSDHPRIGLALAKAKDAYARAEQKFHSDSDRAVSPESQIRQIIMELADSVVDSMALEN